VTRFGDSKRSADHGAIAGADLMHLHLRRALDRRRHSVWPAFGPLKEIGAEMSKRLALSAVFLLVAGVSPAAGPINMISNDIMVPAAGRGPGAAGSFWVTDLWIRCPGGGDAVLEFHALDSPSAAALATATVHMNQPVVYLADVIKNTFGMDSGFGNIRIRSTTPSTATLRLYSQGGGGNYGFAFMGMPSSMSMGASPMMGGDDTHRMYVNGLLPQPLARVNVMVMNTGSLPIQGTVEVLDADGGSPATGPVAMRFSIQPYSGHQFNDILVGVHSRFSDDMGLQLRIHMDDGMQGMMMALATVTDNATNDSYVVMGSMMDAGSMGMMGAQ
jgi:hypothetical protein